MFSVGKRSVGEKKDQWVEVQENKSIDICAVKSSKGITLIFDSVVLVSVRRIEGAV